MVTEVAAVAIVHAYEAGVGSGLPTPSIARTSKVCAPGARPLYDCGEVHAEKAPASRRHSKVATPDPEPSVPTKPKVAEVALVMAAGKATRPVSGAVESTTDWPPASVPLLPRFVASPLYCAVM